ncbi:MAG: thioredoxin family protein [Gammaproteobacteria bacterium]|nr:thioredoxin family protein [Gammaproteobacteria bacterium]
MALNSPICEFGRPAVDFALDDADGRRWTLAGCRGERGTLVMFICNHCPFVQAILQRLVRDTRELSAHGIGSVAIMPNDPTQYPEDSVENMRRIAHREDFPFPYLIDDTQEVARSYGAVCTPDFFGYNTDLELQYRGRLDASGRKPAPPDAPRELYEAMLEIARTGRGPEEQAQSIGCSIKWIE